MRFCESFAPATIRRAFFVFTAAMCIAAAQAAGPATRFPDLAQTGKPGPEEAARLVAQFRNSGISGDYFLEFELHTLLRRGGEGVTVKGRWWGSRNDRGALSRIELTDAAGGAHRFILQNGDDSAVWRIAGDHAAKLEAEEIFAPLVPGLEVSAFDLQMPFLYWSGVTVEKITRVLGRPAHAFLFPAPPAFKGLQADIGAARAYLDTQFNVPMQTELIGRNGRVTKTLELLSLKTVERQTLPKSADYRNEVTRDKTRLQVTGAALNLRFPASVFDPALLRQPATPPASERITRLDP
jgi:hypothetical protein